MTDDKTNKRTNSIADTTHETTATITGEQLATAVGGQGGAAAPTPPQGWTWVPFTSSSPDAMFKQMQAFPGETSRPALPVRPGEPAQQLSTQGFFGRPTR